MSAEITLSLDPAKYQNIFDLINLKLTKSSSLQKWKEILCKQKECIVIN
jgi:hypothetical protein